MVKNSKGWSHGHTQQDSLHYLTSTTKAMNLYRIMEDILDWKRGNLVFTSKFLVDENLL